MQRHDLEEQIIDYIKSLYKAEYIGKLIVTKIGDMYNFSIGIPDELCPTTISGNMESDEEFLAFIYEELRVKNYVRTYFYRVTRTNIYKET